MATRPSSPRSARVARTKTSRTESASDRFDRIHRSLRERICLLDFLPGTVLKEQELAREFGVSRTPVRQVLQRLSYEGLVTIRNGVGTTITDIDIKKFRDVYALRMRLAELVGDLSPTPENVDVATLDQLLVRAQKLKDQWDVKEYARICNELHDAMLDAIGNEALREMTDLLYYRMARVWTSLIAEFEWDKEAEQLCMEISETIDSLRLEDKRDFGFIRRHHLSRLRTRLSQYITTG